MAKAISATNAEHYTWGGTANSDCDAWYLVRTPHLNIIEELMPPGASETPHQHVRARQFFFVLAGELTLTVEGEHFLLHPGEGLEIPPGQMHQAINQGSGPVRFVLTSQPPSHSDRIDVY
jgi:mannose-6-phosphate isomerase-like protein (cupin superfamily)